MKTLIQEVANVDASESDADLNSYEQVLINGLYELEDTERKALFFRFWMPASIEQVAAELKVSWDVADQTINRAIEKLRGHFADREMNSSPFNESRKP